MGDTIELLNDLDEVIKRKQREIRDGIKPQIKPAEPKPELLDANAPDPFGNPEVVDEPTKPNEPTPRDRNHSPKPTRAAVNRANAQKSTGPRSDAGKEKVSANSLKHGYYASLGKLNPRDSLAFHHINASLQDSLHPDGSAETHLVEEIAMLSARLQSLESAQYALIAGNTDGEPVKIENPETYTDAELYDLHQPDARDIAAAYERCLDTLERLTKIETHLRRAYNRTWDRLQRMQKERLKMPMPESIKQTHVRLTNEALKKNRPQDVPSMHPDLDDSANPKTYHRGDPLYLPEEDPDDDNIDHKNSLS